MTTLPQTISARPRPAQSVSAMPAVASPMVMPVPYQGMQGPVQGLTGADIWRVFRQNLWIFLLVIVLSGAAGFGLNEYLKRNYTYYTAQGKVLVQPPARFDPTGTVRLDEQGNDIDLKMILQNQVQQLTNELLLTEILTDANSATRKSTWLQREASRGGRLDQEEALELLQKSFAARAIEGSSIINVSMAAGDPEEARIILEEIVNRRIEQVRDFGQKGTGDQAFALEQLATKQQRDISTMERDIRNLVANMSADDAGDGTALQFRVMEITADQQEAQQEMLTAQSALQSTQESVRKGEMIPEVEMRLQMDPALMPLQRELDTFEIQLEVARQKYGTNNQQFMQLQTQLDIMKEQYAKREEDARARYTQEVLNTLGGALASAEAKYKTLDNQISELNTTLTSISQTKADILSKRDELQSARESLSELNKQIAILQTTIAQRPDEQLNWAIRPIKPTSPSFPRLPMTVGASILVGLGLAVGIAFLREVLDSSVKSPREIARVGQINLLGMIPDQSEDPQAGDPLELTIANAPHSMSAEQFRLMRARLGHLAPLETTRTILVTSPQPGDGKTTVACNLAAGMALNGRKILLVDANFRRPAVHGVFGVENEVGLSNCLANVEAFEGAVHETKIPNLFVLPSGPRPENPSELIEGTAFTDVVDRALEEYDHLIFDSGPILFVSETSALAPQCDGVISVVRARRSTQGLLKRLRDQLRSLNTEHLGVVLNGVRHHAGGYYNREIKTYYAYQGNGRR